MKTLLLVSLLLIVSISFAQDGSPDLSYGDNGVVKHTVYNGTSYVGTITEGKNNTVFVGGGRVMTHSDNFIMAINDDGSIDEEFADNGMIIIPTQNEDLLDIQYMPDGTLLVSSIIDSYYNITKYNLDGSINTSFGDNGRIQPFSVLSNTNFFTIDELGNIYLLARLSGYGPIDIEILKFDSNGVLDINFGNQGIIDLPVHYLDEVKANKVIVKNNSIYILVNYKEENVLENAIIKYSENGLIDSSFGVNGTASIPSVSNFNTTFNLFNNGSFLIGARQIDPVTELYIKKTVKLNADASLNLDFGIDGVIEGFESSHILPDQRFIANANTENWDYGILLHYARFFNNGLQDQTFQFSTNFGSLSSNYSIILNSGKLLTVGTDYYNNPHPLEIVLQKFNNTLLKTPKYKKETFKVYPNPSNGIFTVESSVFYEKENYQITDITGKIIATGQLNELQTQLDLSSAQSGVYFLKISNSVFRLLKN